MSHGRSVLQDTAKECCRDGGDEVAWKPGEPVPFGALPFTQMPRATHSLHRAATVGAEQSLLSNPMCPGKRPALPATFLPIGLQELTQGESTVRSPSPKCLRPPEVQLTTPVLDPLLAPLPGMRQPLHSTRVGPSRLCPSYVPCAPRAPGDQRPAGLGGLGAPASSLTQEFGAGPW